MYCKLYEGWWHRNWTWTERDDVQIYYYFSLYCQPKLSTYFGCHSKIIFLTSLIWDAFSSEFSLTLSVQFHHAWVNSFSACMAHIFGWNLYAHIMWKMNEPGVNERKYKAIEMEKDEEIEWEEKNYIFFDAFIKYCACGCLSFFCHRLFSHSRCYRHSIFKVNAFSH